jgi:hypothetical protein
VGESSPSKSTSRSARSGGEFVEHKLDGEYLSALNRVVAARAALARILEVAGVDCALSDVMGDDALDGLVQFYDDTARDLRKTLAAAHGAAEDAAAIRAYLIRHAHVRVGAANWR